MNPFSIHADSLRALQAEQGSDCPVMWFDGAAVAVLPGGAIFKRENSPGGFMLQADLKLTCLVADFETLPESNDRFNYPGEGGREYSILSVNTAQGGKQLEIEAKDANEGL